ncbi:MAG: hypothetical protein IT307_09835, partial [Chloroflexi bacterium]|nr:hypothetical protein [Chloroflexota bacterium]
PPPPAAGLGQGSLFDDPAQTEAGDILATPLPVAPPLTQRQMLTFEKESLGLFFSNHPFQEASRWLLSQVTTTSDQFGPDLAGEKVTIAGAVSGVRRIMTRKGETMAVVTLEDLSGAFEVAAFPRTYSQFESVWVEDHILLVQGRVDVRDDRCQVICERAEIWEAPAGQPPEAAPEPLGNDGASGSLDAATDPRPAAKRNANGYGGSGTNGNGHSKTSGNGNGRSNGTGHGDGHGGASKPAALAARRLVLTVHPSGDAAADRELVDRLHSLLDREGPDRYQLLLALPTRTVRLRGSGHRTSYSQALEESLRELLGEANVEVQPIRE